MSSLYKKTYGAIKEATTGFANPEAALAFYLEGASKYLTKAAVAAKEDRFEDRANLTQNALLIFYGILSYLEPIPAHEKKGFQGLIEYCRVMTDLIYRMNSKNDPEIGENCAREIKRMADHWKQRSQDVAARNAATSVSRPFEEGQSEPSVTMARPGQSKGSTFGNPGVTASYSA